MTDYNVNPAIRAALDGGYQKGDPARFCYSVPKTALIDNECSKTCKTNYVIATWSGPRRAGNEILEADSTSYLKKHLKMLETLNHHLDQITICVPDNELEPTAFSQYLEVLEKEGRVKILRRPNCGQSYGSWVESYKRFSEFDYYIFVEDDYLPQKNHFDSILISLFRASNNCGYLCTRVDKYPPTNYNGRPHAAISNGITSKEVLSDLIKSFKYGATSAHSYAATPQLEFSWTFLDAGYWLYDYANHYSAPYFHVGKLQTYGNAQLPPLFYPAQLAK